MEVAIPKMVTIMTIVVAFSTKVTYPTPCSTPAGVTCVDYNECPAPEARAGKIPQSDFGIWQKLAVKLDNVVYLSGVLGMNHTTGEVVQDVRLQALQMFANINTIMQFAGISMTSNLQGTLSLTNIEDFKEVVLKVWLEVCNYREYPALSVVEVTKLPRGALMQFDGIAMAGDGKTKFFLIS